MLELVSILLFSFAIIFTTLLKLPLLLALLFGYVVFFSYGILKKHSPLSLLSFSFHGVTTAMNVIITFIVIGMMTGLWRSCGIIAYIVSSSYKFCHPSYITAMIFVLCSIMSMLTGTAFGTGATMGVICSTIALSMGINPVLVGGAVLSGSAFGDRCSPMSAPAHLIANITNSEVYDNCRMMLRSAFIPYVLTFFIYLFIGKGKSISESTYNVCDVFVRNFKMSPWLLLPAFIIIILILFRFKVKYAMAGSIISAIFVGILIQGIEFKDILKALIFGFHPEDKELSRLLGGGGVLSMLNVMGIVLISSSFSGIFKLTGFLDGIKKGIKALSDKTNSFFATLITSIVTSMIGCNQTLATMLCNDVTQDLVLNGKKRAIYLSDTVTVISELVPWSIAGAPILYFLQVPLTGLFFAFFNILLPLCSLLCASFLKEEAYKRYLGLHN